MLVVITKNSPVLPNGTLLANKLAAKNAAAVWLSVRMFFTDDFVGCGNGGEIGTTISAET
jgi:hypothetical protein